jgi:hypothetical protein
MVAGYAPPVMRTRLDLPIGMIASIGGDSMFII